MTKAEDQTGDIHYPTHEGEQVVADPVHIRALTHPVRLRLLGYLDDVSEATATECADAIGESVASCSFHLRTLAKHGYIEPAERRGREKPWKVVSHRRSQVIDRNAPGAAHALSSLASMSVSVQTERIHEWLRVAPSQPIEEVEAASVYGASYYLTLDEMYELREELLRLGERFAGRTANPELRPDGARHVNLFGVLNIDPHDETSGR
ncbi:ArsR/SmtB family transcription factor [Spelaeicoccus albus]|uniref:DNA-binding transcriptional ArsR family regulator n=1 Tax=Spelaeicoccus albus TaxID=1280376 RepID=A0A7Z0ABS3_9MICO|nr:helix-turn-helix domain-containing protein [Spelaeicoccus albus]NYI66246.1 DNA-binding transcriptional ArsR family regulator [Spelaeicoccus albus]